jgi:hypothetical protein
MLNDLLNEQDRKILEHLIQLVSFLLLFFQCVFLFFLN